MEKYNRQEEDQVYTIINPDSNKEHVNHHEQYSSLKCFYIELDEDWIEELAQQKSQFSIMDKVSKSHSKNDGENSKKNAIDGYDDTAPLKLVLKRPNGEQVEFQTCDKEKQPSGKKVQSKKKSQLLYKCLKFEKSQDSKTAIPLPSIYSQFHLVSSSTPSSSSQSTLKSTTTSKLAVVPSSENTFIKSHHEKSASEEPVKNNKTEAYFKQQKHTRTAVLLDTIGSKEIMKQSKEARVEAKKQASTKGKNVNDRGLNRRSMTPSSSPPRSSNLPTSSHRFRSRSPFSRNQSRTSSLPPLNHHASLIEEDLEGGRGEGYVSSSQHHRPSVSSTISNSNKNNIRKKLVHLLALKPIDIFSIRSKLPHPELEINQELLKIARLIKGKYELKPEAYKEVLPYEWHAYTYRDKEFVIKKAHEALDTLKIPDSDRLHLLPRSERPNSPSVLSTHSTTSRQESQNEYSRKPSASKKGSSSSQSNSLKSSSLNKDPLNFSPRSSAFHELDKSRKRVNSMSPQSQKNNSIHREDRFSDGSSSSRACLEYEKRKKKIRTTTAESKTSSFNLKPSQLRESTVSSYKTEDSSLIANTKKNSDHSFTRNASSSKSGTLHKRRIEHRVLFDKISSISSVLEEWIHVQNQTDGPLTEAHLESLKGKLARSGFYGNGEPSIDINSLGYLDYLENLVERYMKSQSLSDE